MTAIDRDQALAALEGLKKSTTRFLTADAIVSSIIDGAIAKVAALPAIPLDREPIEIVQQQAEEDFVEWYERTTKPAPMWAEQAREWAHSLGGFDGGDLAELIGVHFFGELPRALPVLETKKETS